MKYLILLLFPLMSFGQWEYKEVIDSVENDNYSIANNKKSFNGTCTRRVNSGCAS